MASQRKVIDIIRHFSGQANILTVPRIFIDLLDGDLKAALLLSQLLYWQDKTTSQDHSVAKTYAEWQTELGLSRYEVEGAALRLKKLFIIHTKVRKFAGNPTLHYYLHVETLENLVIRFLEERYSEKSHNHLPKTGETISLKDAEHIHRLHTETTSKKTINNDKAQELKSFLNTTFNDVGEH